MVYWGKQSGNEWAAALAGLTLAEDRRSRPRRLLDRAAARIRHIR